MAKVLNYREIIEFQKEYAKDIDANHKGFCNTVQMVYSDGSMALWDGAFVIKYGGWYLVFTEHHRYYMYMEEDCLHMRQFQRIDIKEVKVKKIKGVSA